MAAFALDPARPERPVVQLERPQPEFRHAVGPSKMPGATGLPRQLERYFEFALKLLRLCSKSYGAGVLQSAP